MQTNLAVRYKPFVIILYMLDIFVYNEFYIRYSL